MRVKLLSPYWMPVWFFAGAIVLGTILLHADTSHPGGPLSWVDALFTATSAMCVTGLAVVDTGTYFSIWGQGVILVLIQLGGLGIMTFTTLVIYLLGKRVALGDRIAVGQSLLHDPTFSLGKFLARVVVGTLSLEAVGALLLWVMEPNAFSPYSAMFHSISAFCNAGFSLFPDSLSQWKGHVGINLVFMLLIVAGGLGFAVLNECGGFFKRFLLRREPVRQGAHLLSWHASVVLKTSFFLILAGAVIIFLAETLKGNDHAPLPVRVLTALFQSVSCRTAGFNTVEIGGMTNLSLAVMMVLMIIGGSPGSCAGGIKTTTFRAIWGFIVAQFKGRDQIKVGRFALGQQAVNQSFTLLIMSMFLICVGAFVLTLFEGAGGALYLIARDEFMMNLFEVISAFATVGLSMGLTADLSVAEKVMTVLLMFVGRLGPVWLLSALHSWQSERRYRLPEGQLPLG